jgi:hypothetical protein
MDEMRITPPETKELMAKSDDLLNRAQILQIRDTASYEAAGALAIEIKSWTKTVEDKFKPSCDAAYQAHRTITAFRNETLAPYEEAENIVNQAMGEYRKKVEAKRKAEADAAADKARKEAEEKRKKEIEAAKAAGDKEGAKNLKAAPIIATPAPVKTQEPPKIKGVTVRKVWDFQIVDDNKIPRKYWALDLTAIRKVVQALGANHGIPGVAAFQKEIQ